MLAIGLLRRHVSVQIYEAAAAFGETGLGLTVGPAAHRDHPDRCGAEGTYYGSRTPDALRPGFSPSATNVIDAASSMPPVTLRESSGSVIW